MENWNSENTSHGACFVLGEADKEKLHAVKVWVAVGLKPVGSLFIPLEEGKSRLEQSKFLNISSGFLGGQVERGGFIIQLTVTKQNLIQSWLSLIEPGTVLRISHASVQSNPCIALIISILQITKLRFRKLRDSPSIPGWQLAEAGVEWGLCSLVLLPPPTPHPSIS